MRSTKVIPLDVLEASIQEVAAEIDAAHEHLADLKARSRALRDLIALAVDPEGVEERQSPTQAIFGLVKSEPGLTPTVIADRLEGVVDSTSSNKRRLIQNMADQLRRRGKLVRDGDGGLYMPDAAKALLNGTAN